MTPADLTAVIVTRGGYDISDVLESLRDFDTVDVWDNSRMRHDEDAKVFGRYRGADLWGDSFVAFQDDDCIVDWAALCALWQPGKIICNMPEPWRPAYEGTGISLVGFGCIFERSLLWDGFQAYDAADWPHDEVFLRECDRVWTHGNRDRIIWADVPMKRLDRAFGPDRMYRENRHGDDLKEIRRRLASL